MDNVEFVFMDVPMVARGNFPAYSPARTEGPVEACYEAEGGEGEANLTAILIGGEDVTDLLTFLPNNLLDSLWSAALDAAYRGTKHG